MSFSSALFIGFWTAGVLGSLSWLLYPSFRNRATKAAAVRFGKQLQQQSTLGETVVSTLLQPVGWISLKTQLPIESLLTLLTNLPCQVGEFFIHYRQPVTEGRYLLITTVNDAQPYEFATVLGSSSSYIVTRTTYNLNFVVQLDELKNRVVVLSDPYTSLADKNLRADFVPVLEKLLQAELSK